MPNFNQAIIVGHVGKMGELRKTTNSVALDFTVAVKDGYGDRQETDWFNVQCYGKTAESMVKLMKVGDLVQVCGKHRSRRVARDDGSSVIYWNLVAFSVLLLRGSTTGKTRSPDVRHEHGEDGPGRDVPSDWQGGSVPSGPPVRNDPRDIPKGDGAEGVADDIPF